MITAIGGIASATADITIAAVIEYSRTTAHARMKSVRHVIISAK